MQVPLGMAVGTYVAALLAQVPVAVVVSANVGWCFGCCFISLVFMRGFHDLVSTARRLQLFGSICVLCRCTSCNMVAMLSMRIRLCWTRISCLETTGCATDVSCPS